MLWQNLRNAQALIGIIPITENDEEPKLYHTEFVVEEGGALTIDLPKLNAEDDDVPEDELIFTITQPPHNGKFIRVVSLSWMGYYYIFIECIFLEWHHITDYINRQPKIVASVK